jgi:hypothetical protein
MAVFIFQIKVSPFNPCSTTSLTLETFCFAHTVYLYVSCGSYSKMQLFSSAVLNNWSYEDCSQAL